MQFVFECPLRTENISALILKGDVGFHNEEKAIDIYQSDFN